MLVRNKNGNRAGSKIAIAICWVMAWFIFLHDRPQSNVALIALVGLGAPIGIMVGDVFRGMRAAMFNIAGVLILTCVSVSDNFGRYELLTLAIGALLGILWLIFIAMIKPAQYDPRCRKCQGTGFHSDSQHHASRSVGCDCYMRMGQT